MIPVSASSHSRRHGPPLRTKHHTATGKQSQVLVAAVNRHMPATPASGSRHLAPGALVRFERFGPRFPRARRPHSMSRSRPAAFGRIFSMISAQLVSWSDRSEGGAVVAHLKTAKLVSDRSEPIDEVGFALANAPSGVRYSRQQFEAA